MSESEGINLYELGATFVVTEHFTDSELDQPEVMALFDDAVRPNVGCEYAVRSYHGEDTPHDEEAALGHLDSCPHCQRFTDSQQSFASHLGEATLRYNASLN
jgi:hypothetical protein